MIASREALSRSIIRFGSIRAPDFYPFHREFACQRGRRERRSPLASRYARHLTQGRASAEPTTPFSQQQTAIFQTNQKEQEKEKEGERKRPNQLFQLQNQNLNHESDDDQNQNLTEARTRT